MMSTSRGYCVILLITILAGSSSGTGITSIRVCLNDSVQVFQGITSASGNSELSLYLNGLKNTLVAMWSVKNSTLSDTILPGYKEKVFREKDGSIWIRNVNLSDEANYVLQYDINTLSTKSSTKSEVQVEVMVAPNKDCKPRIQRLNTSLNASLDASACGKPVVSVYWLDFHGNSFTDKTINLPPGSETGTYYACIEGPAVKCANTFKQMDYCSKYPIGGGVVHRHVCLGDSVQLINSGDTDVSLYKHGTNVTFLAKWSTKNSVVTSSIPSKYKHKVHLDGNGTLWIQNVNLSDEGKYIIQYVTNGSPSNSEVQIDVMVAPSQRCIPKIHLLDNILQASLQAEYCGTPAASVNLLDLHRNLYKNESVNILPGSEARTYYACIEGPALTCVNTSTKLEYCSTYTIGGTGSPQSASVNTPVIVMSAIYVVSLLVALVYWRKSLIDKCYKGAQGPNPTQREATGCLAKFKTRIHERFRLPCPVKGCENTFFTQARLDRHINAHMISDYKTSANTTNADITGVVSKANLDIINLDTLPSQSHAKTSKATSSLEEGTPLLPSDGTKIETSIEVIEEGTPLLPSDGTKIETPIEVIDYPAKRTSGGRSMKRARLHCPVEKCQQKYSSKKRLCQHISEHHPGSIIAGNPANQDINTHLSSEHIDTSSRYALPSQTKDKSIQSTSISGQDISRAADGSKMEILVQVHESTKILRAESRSRKREMIQCPKEQSQHRYSYRESLCQHTLEQHPDTRFSNVNRNTRDTLQSQGKANSMQSTSISGTSRLYVDLEKLSNTYHCVKDGCEDESHPKASLGQSTTRNLRASVSENEAAKQDIVERLAQEDPDSIAHCALSSLSSSSSEISVNFNESSSLPKSKSRSNSGTKEQQLSMSDHIEKNGIPVSPVLE